MSVGDCVLISQDKWVWMPHAGHFICGARCQFKLNTRVGKYIISTVGGLTPLSNDDGPFEKIGLDRLYETMVFDAVKSKEKCCPYRMKTPTELDFEGYNDSGKAYKGHMKMCLKWAKKQK